MNWFAPDEKPASRLGRALQTDVMTSGECRAKASTGDRAAQRRLDSRDLGGRVAEALRTENPGGPR